MDTKNAERHLDTLSKYAVDLTVLAFTTDGKIDPVADRDKDIHRIIRTLIGEPCVGKTAVVEVANVSVSS